MSSSSFQWLCKASSSLFSSPLYQNQVLRSAFIFLGGALLTTKFFNSLRILLRPLFIREKDLAARYGKGSWAVITGGSDGIGKSFCFQFAKRGFNIIIVARNQAKSEAVAQEIRTQHPLVEVKVVVADFSKAFEEGFAEEIEKQTAGLDISVVVNNVGQLGTGRYVDFSTSTLRDLIIVNCLSQAVITRVFLPRLIARSQKSAIINMSSIASQQPRPFFQMYSSTKVFNDFFARGLAHEYPNIDVLSLKPALVSTNMTNNKAIDIQTITTEELTSTGLKHLGNTLSTFGAWKHRLYAFQLWSMPENYRARYFKKRFERFQQKWN